MSRRLLFLLVLTLLLEKSELTGPGCPINLIEFLKITKELLNVMTAGDFGELYDKVVNTLSHLINFGRKLNRFYTTKETEVPVDFAPGMCSEEISLEDYIYQYVVRYYDFDVYIDFNGTMDEACVVKNLEDLEDVRFEAGEPEDEGVEVVMDTWCNNSAYSTVSKITQTSKVDDQEKVTVKLTSGFSMYANASFEMEFKGTIGQPDFMKKILKEITKMFDFIEDAVQQIEDKLNSALGKIMEKLEDKLKPIFDKIIAFKRKLLIQAGEKIGNETTKQILEMIVPDDILAWVLNEEVPNVDFKLTFADYVKFPRSCESTFPLEFGISPVQKSFTMDLSTTDIQERSTKKTFDLTTDIVVNPRRNVHAVWRIIGKSIALRFTGKLIFTGHFCIGQNMENLSKIPVGNLANITSCFKKRHDDLLVNIAGSAMAQQSVDAKLQIDEILLEGADEWDEWFKGKTKSHHKKIKG